MPTSQPLALTSAQENFLTYGPRDDHDGAFDDEEAVLQAWAQHRERILARYQGGGRRPWGFWAIDHPELPWRGYDRQRSILYGAGLLSEQDRTGLVSWWRAEYVKAEGLDAGARRQRHREIDIPRSLLREWNAERRRRGKIIRKLETTATQSNPAA
jgi:hypothetical protein